MAYGKEELADMLSRIDEECLLHFSRCGVPQIIGAPFHGASVRACAQYRCGRAA
jgi:hypothetical protein